MTSQSPFANGETGISFYGDHNFEHGYLNAGVAGIGCHTQDSVLTRQIVDEVCRCGACQNRTIVDRAQKNPSLTAQTRQERAFVV